jgi:hypothetical protein
MRIIASIAVSLALSTPVALAQLSPGTTGGTMGLPCRFPRRRFPNPHHRRNLRQPFPRLAQLNRC